MHRDAVDMLMRMRIRLRIKQRDSRQTRNMLPLFAVVSFFA